MSKEFTCNQCKKKTITEREDTRHTDYSYGLCEECKPPPKLETVEETDAQLYGENWNKEPEPGNEKANPLACRECEFIAKTPFGLQSHMRVHKKEKLNNAD